MEKGREGDERRTAEGGKSGWRVRNDMGGFVGEANKCFLQHKTHAFVLKPNIERIRPSCRDIQSQRFKAQEVRNVVFFFFFYFSSPSIKETVNFRDVRRPEVRCSITPNKSSKIQSGRLPNTTARRGIVSQVMTVGAVS